MQHLNLWIKEWWQDIRSFQILFLSAFLLLGIFSRDWTIRPELILVLIFSCLLTQLLLPPALKLTYSLKSSLTTPNPSLLNQIINSHSLSSCRSAMITALGLCLLLRGNEPLTMAIAGFSAIASKFLFRWQEKHFFNPANFGIIMVLLLTQDAWVSPGQWGADWWYALVFLGTGGMILQKMGRGQTTGAFLLTYTTLEVIRNRWLGESWEILQHQLMSGSLLLFALFMLSDPRSIPNASMSRLVWSMMIAGLAFTLQHLFFLPSAIFWALFLLSPMTIILDKYWSAARFSWNLSVRKEPCS